ncbi:MAG: hypothetical protein RJA26_755 [Actinomycetota bacterium]
MTLLWAVENNSTVDWTAAYRTAADFWLAAHGVHISVPAQTIAGVEAPDFTISMIPLGLTALIIGLAFRIGQRLATSQVLWPGWVAIALVYGGFSLLISNTVKSPLAAPDSAQGTLIPPLVFVVVALLSSIFAKPADLGVAHLQPAKERLVVRAWVNQRWEALGWWANVVLPPALRAGTAIVVSLIGVSAVTLALQLAFNWIEVIRLYESMQLTLLGGILLTVGQIVFLPNFVLFGADWFTGAGFAIGTGSLVSPLGSQLGPLPALPIFAALPAGELSFGMIAIAIPVVAAIVATLRIRSHAAEMRFEFASPITAALSLGIPVALVAALELLLANLLTRGSIGPGRFADVGGNPLTTAAALFVEVALVSTIAAFYTASPDAPDSHLVERAKASVARFARTEENVDSPEPSAGSGFEPER